MARNTINKDPNKLRSRKWFANPENPDMTALYLERYMNFGLTRQELQAGKPIIAIAQSGSDLSPCNRHHLELAHRVREGIREAGGIAFEVPLHPIQETGKRPTAALVGGAKISSKIAVLENLVGKMDRIIIGGGMANTFLLAKGIPVGKSLIEADMVETAARIMDKAKEGGCEILLPSDVVVAESFAANAPHVVVPVDKVSPDGMILDVGPETVATLKSSLGTLATLLWNGPLGAFELEPFGNGTFGVARAAADLVSAGKLVAVAGGGDTVAALNAAGVADRFTYVSTAGGAFLEWLEGRELPGVIALLDNQASAQKKSKLEEVR